MLQIAPSGYWRHAAHQRNPQLRCQRAQCDDTLVPHIERVWQANMQIYGAFIMANALKRTVTKLPSQLWQSMTWDRGKELSDHARFTIESGVKVFFADPHSPWHRGTNENTNGLLRQYCPKGSDLSRWSEQEIQAVALTLNNRPRKTLGWMTPAEALNDYLISTDLPGVATTG